MLMRLETLVSEDDYNWLAALALDTARLLATDDFHATGNNHGNRYNAAVFILFDVVHFGRCSHREHTDLSPDGV
jgi:hypothetical protein